MELKNVKVDGVDAIQPAAPSSELVRPTVRKPTEMPSESNQNLQTPVFRNMVRIIPIVAALLVSPLNPTFSPPFLMKEFDFYISRHPAMPLPLGP